MGTEKIYVRDQPTTEHFSPRLVKPKSLSDFGIGMMTMIIDSSRC